MMLKKFALVALVALPLSGISVAAEPSHEAALPRQAASGASAPAQHKSPGNKQHQLLAACNKKVSDAGITGDARKQAVNDCLKNS